MPPDFLCIGNEAGESMDSMESLDRLEEQLRERETALHRQEVRASASRLSELIDDDFFEFGVSGAMWDKRAVIDALKNESFSERSISDFKITLLAPDVALVTYRSHRAATAARPGADSLRSSIWKRISGQWKMVFHQGTTL